MCCRRAGFRAHLLESVPLRAVCGAGVSLLGSCWGLQIADTAALQAKPSDAALLERHALGPAMRDATLRRLELSNWLVQAVRQGA